MLEILTGILAAYSLKKYCEVMYWLPIHLRYLLLEFYGFQKSTESQNENEPFGSFTNFYELNPRTRRGASLTHNHVSTCNILFRVRFSTKILNGQKGSSTTFDNFYSSFGPT